jgi:TonB dependent receptor/Carboxypeptidase regulatory-like domain
MTQKLTTLVVVIGVLATSVSAQNTRQGTSSVQGVVFTIDSQGGHPVVPGAKISLDGPAHLEAKADAEGKFAISGIAPGSYAITAKAPGMAGAQNLIVTAGKVLQVPVELKLKSVNESVTVKDNANQVDTREVSGTNSISEPTVRNMPNRDERFDSLLPLVPGVVRGTNGLINMKGARATQNGSLVNSADVTDPATGATAINIPIDVVSSIKVLATPYDPEYGKFTGAVSNVETRSGEFNKLRVSAQNFVPHLRRLDGSIMGIAAATPRITFSAPIIKNRIAFTESVEYRYGRDPVNSLPPLQSDTRRESFASYSQIDANIGEKQTATASFAIFPQKLDYYGLNTFTTQASTPDLHERGYQMYVQHRYVTGSGDLLTSQVSFRKFDADLSPNSNGPYQLSIETTNGGFFNLQNRETSHTEWEEIFHSHTRQFHGSHDLQAGIEFAHGSYDGRQNFRPVDILGIAGVPLERIQFGPASRTFVDQNEIAWFVGDKWTISKRLTFDLGLRFDRDSVTDSVNTAPRAGFVLALSKDGRTLLKGGTGLFYDRVPLNIPTFPHLPMRTIEALSSTAGVVSSTEYSNVVSNGLQNPRSEVWNLEIDREVVHNLLVRLGYQQRTTVHGFVLTPTAFGSTGILSLSNRGHDFYREFQVTGRYQIGRSTFNASYVHSKAFGDLNDFNQFFGNDPEAVIQPNQRGRLAFDAPNRILVWGEIAAPWKLTVSPVLDIHTGFPYSAINQFRDFVGPRNKLRFPRFVSSDLQVLRRIRLPIKDKHARVGFGVYNIFNRFNPRDVQSDLDSFRYGEFFNDVGRSFHGKFILEL